MPAGAPPAPARLEGGYCPNQGLEAPDLTAALTGIRKLETLYDIPHADKLKMLRAAVDKCPAVADEGARTAARLKRFHSHPRYHVFYEIQPLLDWLKRLGSPSDLPIDVLTRATIVALRVTTLMGSGDLQNLVNNVYTRGSEYYLVSITFESIPLTQSAPPPSALPPSPVLSARCSVLNL